MNQKQRKKRAQKAGKSRSAAKAAAARKNGKSGGRPKNSGSAEIKKIMEERGVSRQRAHQISKQS